MMLMRKVIWWGVGFVAFVLFMDSVVMPLFVRKGEEFPLPDVTSLPITDARKTVEALGLELEIIGSEHSPARLEGTVLSQEPPGNSAPNALPSA